MNECLESSKNHAITETPTGKNKGEKCVYLNTIERGIYGVCSKTETFDMMCFGMNSIQKNKLNRVFERIAGAALVKHGKNTGGYEVFNGFTPL